MPRRTIRRKSQSTSSEKFYRGPNAELIGSRDSEVILSGPAGTGKSLACLHKIHACASKKEYAGMRGLIVRKTRSSLTESALFTFERHVLIPYWYNKIAANAERKNRHNYLYSNGSEIIVGGMDKASKVMSTEYDIIYVQEAIELTEADHEALTSRLRNGVMPYQQLIGDTNPDAPTHWLKRRAESGLTRMLESRHEQNPLYWDADRGEWTEVGKVYMARLARLTGIRKLRLHDGLWVGAEGLIYDEWDPAIHQSDDDFHPVYYIGSQDWGYTNAGVFGVWGVDGDGRMKLVHEVYRTGKLIGWWTLQAFQAHERFHLQSVPCDPSEPAYIEAYKQAGIPAVPGYNAVKPGIQAVKARMQVAGNGRPRIIIPPLDPADRDPELIAANKPTCTVDEIPSYVWAPSKEGPKKVNDKEEPKKVNDHGCDMTRYAVSHLDLEDHDNTIEAAANPTADRWWGR